MCAPWFGLSVIVAVTLGAAPALHALGIRIHEQDPTATSRGEAFTATADNPAAIYYNPAGLTQLEGTQFQLGTYHIAINSTHRAPGTGQFSDTPDRFQTAAQMFFTRTLESSRVAFGLGVYSPYGLGSKWPDESPFRSYSTQAELQFLSINPVIAWKVAETLSVAAGFTANYAHADLRRGLFSPGDELRLEGEGWSYGFTAGLLWQPSPRHSFGFMYRSRSHLNFEGDVRLRTEVPLPVPTEERATFEFDFPQHVMFGYSFRPTPEWNLEINADWTDWDDVGTLRIRQPSGDNFQVFDWESSWVWKFGVTRKFASGWSVSAGYFHGESVTPDRNYNPAVPDVDMHVFSLGAAYRSARWSCACTYSLGYGPEQTVRGSTPSPTGQSADGEYTFLGHGLSLGFGLSF
jgi:long-chain fatty acid transport protein